MSVQHQLVDPAACACDSVMHIDRQPPQRGLCREAVKRPRDYRVYAQRLALAAQAQKAAHDQTQRNAGPARVHPPTAVERNRALGAPVKLEASGSVSLETVRAIAETGVDVISVGALTHSAPVLDIGLDAD